jgi:hypothetical protein
MTKPQAIEPAGPFSAFPLFLGGPVSELFYSTRGEHYWYDGTVSIDNAPELPSVAGHYFVLNDLYKVLYVGQSINIRKRWFEGHHQFFRAKEAGGVRIGYVRSLEGEFVAEDRSAAKAFLLKEERVLIKLYAPTLNRESVDKFTLRNRYRRNAVRYFERLAKEARLLGPLQDDSVALFFYAAESYLGREGAITLYDVATRDRYPHKVERHYNVLLQQDETFMERAALAAQGTTKKPQHRSKHPAKTHAS